VEEQHPGPPWTERLRLEGAELVAEEPMITRHAYGQGVAWYVAGELDDAGWARFVAGGATTPGLELVRREGWLFAINHTGVEQEIEAHGEECLTGTTAPGRWRLPAGGVAAFREKS
jgi:beta-galactosidase